MFSPYCLCPKFIPPGVTSKPCPGLTLHSGPENLGELEHFLPEIRLAQGVGQIARDRHHLCQPRGSKESLPRQAGSCRCVYVRPLQGCGHARPCPQVTIPAGALGELGPAHWEGPPLGSAASLSPCSVTRHGARIVNPALAPSGPPGEEEHMLNVCSFAALGFKVQR